MFPTSHPTNKTSQTVVNMTDIKQVMLSKLVTGALLRSISRRAMTSEATEKLRSFGYAFNKEGALRKIDPATGETGSEHFKFDVYDDYGKNQRRYEEIAKCIPDIVYELLEEHGMFRTYTPDDIPKEQATFIFTSPQKLNKSKKLLVLIHGSGYVRAGQWARSLIINNSLKEGTMIPYVDQAKSTDFDVLIMNTNDNYRPVDGAMKAIPGHTTPIAHALTVWEKYVIGSEPESVAIVAHSYGGSITLTLAKKYAQFFKDKVFAIALTDSAHAGGGQATVKAIRTITKNFVTSDEPAGTEIDTPNDDIPRVSAGHTKHEWTSHTAKEEVFTFIEERYKSFMQKKKNKSEL